MTGHLLSEPSTCQPPSTPSALLRHQRTRLPPLSDITSFAVRERLSLQRWQRHVQQRDVQLCATAAEEEEGVSRKTTAEKDPRAAPPEQDSWRRIFNGRADDSGTLRLNIVIHKKKLFLRTVFKVAMSIFSSIKHLDAYGRLTGSFYQLNLRWLNPLKFNSQNLSSSTENCWRLFLTSHLGWYLLLSWIWRRKPRFAFQGSQAGWV